MVQLSSETTPLIAHGNSLGASSSSASGREESRVQLYEFLEAKTPAGQWYEYAIMGLIAINVLAFILASLFVEEYNGDAGEWARRDTGICQNLCDALWFGNYRDNGLGFLGLGSTSILELVTIAVFSVEYILRLYTCDLEDPKYQGVFGRLRYIPTFFSLVDLASTIPFYVDAFVFRDTDLAGSAFLRMFRLLRMMRVEGRYDSALSMVDDLFLCGKDIVHHT